LSFEHRADEETARFAVGDVQGAESVAPAFVSEHESDSDAFEELERVSSYAPLSQPAGCELLNSIVVAVKHSDEALSDAVLSSPLHAAKTKEAIARTARGNSRRIFTSSVSSRWNRPE
jgi:hypothetical protein